MHAQPLNGTPFGIKVLFGPIWLKEGHPEWNMANPAGHTLLPIPKGGVCDPDLIGHVDGHQAVVEGDLRNGGIIEALPIEVWFLHILKRIFVFGLLVLVTAYSGVVKW